MLVSSDRLTDVSEDGLTQNVRLPCNVSNCHVRNENFWNGIEASTTSLSAILKMYRASVVGSKIITRNLYVTFSRMQASFTSVRPADGTKYPANPVFLCVINNRRVYKI